MHEPSKSYGGIFASLRILEIASALAGPQTGTFFKELGAQILKIENKTRGGDISRHWKLKGEDRDTPDSVYYCSINGNKANIQLDLSDSNDYGILLDHVRNADIVITNFTQTKATEFGLRYKDLCLQKSDIILANVTGFGTESNRQAFDVLLQAEAGYLSMTGHRGGEPTKIPLPIIDILAAHQLKEAILCALLKKLQSGEGSYIELSLLDTALASLANQASTYLMLGQVPGPLGTRHPAIAPYGDIYKCADGEQIILAIGTDKQFNELCSGMDLEANRWEFDFKTNADRVMQRDRLNIMLGQVFSEKSSQHWIDLFRKNGILGGKVKNLAEVLDEPGAKNMIVEEQMPSGVLSRRVKNIAFRVLS